MLPIKAARPTRHLLKTQPDRRPVGGKDVGYGIDDLERDGTVEWAGVRGDEAARRLREMKRGDQVLIYHSGTRERGIVGLASIVSGGHPDESAFDPASPFYDPESSRAAPRWFSVKLTFQEKFAHPITHAMLKRMAWALEPDDWTGCERTGHAFDLGLGILTKRDVPGLKALVVTKPRQPSVQPVGTHAFARLVWFAQSGHLHMPPVQPPWRTRLRSDPELNDPEEQWPVEDDLTDVEWEAENARATRRRRAAAGQPDAPAPAAKKRSAAATTGSAAAGEGSEQPRRSRRARP